MDHEITEGLTIEEPSEGVFRIKNSWFRQSSSGLYELYAEGDDFERGVIIGRISKKLVRKQEDIFVSQIKEMVPSKWKRSLAHHLIAWYNRNLHKHVKEEYKKEIYGVSLSLSDKYDFIGPAYNRVLNYHAAHDIGHALQGFNIVGCTSFATWGSNSEKDEFFIGRNFDFSVNDAFAADKIILFCSPDKGLNFSMVTWGGMMGTLSGMNEAGLTVTLNAAKSELPTSSATPVSLLAREILQYATTIDEAYAIAKDKEVFVSESFLIGSSKDGIAAIIEKTPNDIGITYPNDEHIICSNHYQSKALKDNPLNQENIATSTSIHRQNRVEHLLKESRPVNPEKIAEILRDRKGPDGTNVGMGNELAINQLAAHHSVIFQPDSLRMWVSTSPYQLGAYQCYDLNKVFNTTVNDLHKNKEITEKSLTIAPDQFLNTQAFKNYQQYKILKKKVKNATELQTTLSKDTIETFISTNPDYFYTYELAGDYYAMKKNAEKSKQYYSKALTLRVANQWEKERIQHKLSEVK